ncbi:SusC/RagA family TonB-linked outer membrane protein [Pedobacter gandavensis]|uniref:SusC/RagA family TonB-linked outer membrane protein n=1 Tax=Pedobacter gandavensis TaxID=2679963 RepID=A0ABR6F2H0_9SPHI|nr:TonB-dependent receptor [Pedobacter gandavensis]MBB2151411.1 SusC/RagA family TonB-linked outer membrane protein [Pedobacter gandavensis]
MGKLYKNLKFGLVKPSHYYRGVKTFALIMLMCLTAFTSFAQSIKVTGTVKDSKGEAMPGVSVKVKDTKTATVTTADGKFSLAVPSEQSVLVLSFIGYDTKEVTVGASRNLNVTLQEQNNNLNDVVVVGYGVQKKVNVIGSVSTIDAKSLENRPVTNISSALAGLSSGVFVKQGSGKPGSDGATIRIRGTGTINNNNALVVVDGIVGSMDAVNPNDVESISILKDAAASSIYGSLAANGVILITTKKGTKGKTTVTYSGLASIAKPANLPTFVTDYITHMNLVNEGYRNLGQTPVYTDATIALWAAANANPGGFTAQGIPNNVAFPNTNWGKTIFENNLVQQHNISLNGGTEKTQYLLSGLFLNNPGVMANTGSDKYSLRINLQSKITDFLTVGTQTFGSYQNYGLASTDNAFNFLRQTTPGVYPMYDGKFGFPAAAEESATANNISAYLYGTGGEDNESRLNTTVFAKFDILKGLSFETRFNYQTRQEEFNNHSITNERWNFATNTLKTAATTPDQLSTSYGFNKNKSYTIDNVLNYKTTIAKDHDIAALVGYNQNYYKYYNFGASKKGLIDETITTLSSATNLVSATGSAYDYALRSYFGRLNYAYKNRYLVEGVFRYDGSSKFSSENRWGFFPAFSAGWRISEESFMSGLNEYVGNLKLRASWGKTGNNVMNTDPSLGNYDYQALYGPTNYSFNGAASTGLISTKFANRNLVWESTTTTNIGLDGNLLKGALTFEIDLYKKYTDGILFPPTIPLTTGTATAATENIAQMSNKGVEISLGYHGKAGDFKYGVSGNFAYNFNRIKKFKGPLQAGYTTDAAGNTVYTSNLGNISSGGTNRVLDGHEYNEYYLQTVYKGSGNYFTDGKVNVGGGPKDGMIRTTDDMAWLNAMMAAGYTFQPTAGVSKTKIYYGDLIYADNNGDGFYGNSFDGQFMNKSSTPRYNYGAGINLSYKNIDMSMIWAGSAGMWYYWNATGYNNSIVSLGNAVSTLIANDHYYYNDANPSDPANNITAHYPRLKNTTDAQNAAVASDFYLYNASYLKLKNLQIGYTIPEKISQKASISRARIYFSGENLWTITKYPGLDPEIGANVGYPTMRQYSVGLNVTF